VLKAARELQYIWQEVLKQQTPQVLQLQENELGSGSKGMHYFREAHASTTRCYFTAGLAKN